MKPRLTSALAALAACVLLAACGKSNAPLPAPKAAAPAAAAVPAPADKPVLHGVIQDILPDRSSLVIKHEAIPGVMGGMTMAFRVDAATLQKAQKGQSITGDFEASGMNFGLSNVKLGPAPANAPAAAPAAGMSMPMMPGMKMDMPAAPSGK